MKALATVLLVLALTSVAIAHNTYEGYSCNHNASSFTIAKPSDGEFEGHERRRLSSTYIPLRITYDFTRLSTLSSSQVSAIEQIVKVSADFFSHILSVPSSTGNNMIPSGQTTCGVEITYSATDMSTGFANSDLHLYVTYVDTPSSSYLAYAAPCSINGNYRPNVGKIVFNSAYLQSAYTDPAMFNGLYKIVSHEMTHVIGFSQSLYPYFLDPTNGYKPYYLSSVTKIFTTNSEGAPIITSPNVMAFAKSYYGCATIQGMRVEDEGTSGSTGSHWERSILENEYMTASAIGFEAAVSGFTIAILQDAGWYQVNASVYDQITWGKGRGCAFVTGACNAGTFAEFPAVGTQTCNYQASAKGLSTTGDMYANGCAYAVKYSTGICQDSTQNSASTTVIQGESYTTSSRCFVGTVVDSRYTSSATPERCYVAKCVTTATGAQNVAITLQNSAGYTASVTCTTDGQILTVNQQVGCSTGQSGCTTFKGSLTCPASISNFCLSATICPNFCSTNGYCLGGTCFCMSGYSGADCSVVGSSSSTSTTTSSGSTTTSSGSTTTSSGSTKTSSSGSTTTSSGSTTTSSGSTSTSSGSTTTSSGSTSTSSGSTTTSSGSTKTSSGSTTTTPTPTAQNCPVCQLCSDCLTNAACTNCPICTVCKIAGKIP